MPHTPRIPEIPGELVHPEYAENLRRLVAQLCNANSTKFPGSQPVSFAQQDLERLEREDFWVCEKSDGVRVLFFVHSVKDSQDVYLIDRHNQYRLINGFFFPHHENPLKPLRTTILDGELVIDIDPRTKKETLRMLAFDCLVVDNQNVMSRPLDKRYGRLNEWFYKPFEKMIQEYPHMLQTLPFEIKIKNMQFSYGIEKVFNDDIPKLQHGNDGLIFTCSQTPYVIGTDQNIKKWKPPSENTIDFKLVLRFPPDPTNPSQPDYLAKPFFALHVFAGGKDPYEFFDELYVDDDEWEKMKLSGEQIDDRIVEVFWQSSEKRWGFMRFRDDKPNGNHKTVVFNIIQSIIDGVEKDDLLARTNSIRTAWKARAQQTYSRGPPSGSAGVRPRATSEAKFSLGRISSASSLDLRYGPLQESPYSRVGGPATIFGFNR